MAPSRKHDGCQTSIDFPELYRIPSIELPVLFKKPSYGSLIRKLKDLEIAPTSWNRASPEDSTSKEGKAVSQFLLSIISNDLGWLDIGREQDDGLADQKEEIWELASRRLAERCGRSAMPEMIRTWVVSASATLPELKFEIREPPLTGDSLGLKTWGTAFAIVKKLEHFGYAYFDHLFHGKSERSTRVLELGSGTGLVGIAAGAIWRTQVILTDLLEIQENLRFNISKNAFIVNSMGGGVVGEVLDWKDPKGLVGCSPAEFEIIVAADVLYDDEHPQLVARNIKRYLKPQADSRVLVAVPMRDSHAKSMVEELRQLMQRNGFRLLHQGKEICHDDWAEDDGEDAVKCWWGIWSPSATEMTAYAR